MGAGSRGEVGYANHDNEITRRLRRCSCQNLQIGLLRPAWGAVGNMIGCIRPSPYRSRVGIISPPSCPSQEMQSAPMQASYQPTQLVQFSRSAIPYGICLHRENAQMPSRCLLFSVNSIYFAPLQRDAPRAHQSASSVKSSAAALFREKRRKRGKIIYDRPGRQAAWSESPREED